MNDCDIPTVILHPANQTQLPAYQADEQPRGKITTDGMSQWINVLRALMLVQIITYHYNSANYYNKVVPAYIYSVHPFTGHGQACNYVFFMFAQYFGFAHFHKLADLPIGQFTLYFVKHLLILAMGYESLIFCIFGEPSRKVTVEAISGTLFWKDVLMPGYYPWRNVGHLSNAVSGSSWFIFDLMNQEAVFYIFYYVYHLLWRACKNEYVWTACYAAVITVIFPTCVYFGKLSYFFYFSYAGNLLFLTRNLLSLPKINVFFTYLYYSKKATIWRAVLGIAFFYVWLVTGRHPQTRNCSSFFIFVPLAIDLFPHTKLWFLLETAVKEINRIQMELYLLHSPFAEHHMPRGMPYVLPEDFETITPITQHWFMSWQSPLLFMQLSYPLWFLGKPFNELVDWADALIHKKQKINWWHFGLSMLAIACITTLVTLQQCRVFGVGEIPASAVSRYYFQWAL